jgi:uncharacterized NAD(P)/FAD-binding protein YdhS
MKTRNASPRTVAIIGGGISGVLTAYHLIQREPQARVIVIDPRLQFGLGLAYSTPSLCHLLNVAAGKISALRNDPDHFLNWLRANYDREATPMTFAQRAVFGRYIQSLLAGVEGIEQVCASVVNYRPTNGGAILSLNNGCELLADYVVLATGNFDPDTLPGISEATKASGAYCHNAWIPGTYEGLNVDAPVTLIGTGLTTVDVLLRLRELGHRGTITAISRHGRLPNRHAPYTPIGATAIQEGTPATCVAYLRALREAIRNGAEWRAAIDSLRATTNDLWLALPLKEQQRFRRHLQCRWGVVRHRMAPQIAAIVETELEACTFIIREGHLARVESINAGAWVTIRTANGTEGCAAARVINCTGPNMTYRRVGSPLLDSLFAQGLVSAGPLGGGFRCSRMGAMIDVDGQESNSLFNIGQGRLGTLLESIAVPEIREQAVELASLLAERLRQEELSGVQVAASEYAPQDLLEDQEVGVA